MKSINIRPFRNSDLSRVLDIFRLNTPSFFAPPEIKDLKEYLDQHQGTYCVLEYNSKIAGSGGYHIPDERTGRLSWFFFNPELQGHGLGKAIVKHCLEELQINHPNLESVEVWTSQYAEGFFSKFGFKTIRIEEDHWAKRIDLYLMKKQL
ncbi:MAG: GNAT family N-acetyltransferase [Bacteroidota bacterium]